MKKRPSTMCGRSFFGSAVGATGTGINSRRNRLRRHSRHANNDRNHIHPLSMPACSHVGIRYDSHHNVTIGSFFVENLTFGPYISRITSDHKEE